MELSIIIVNWRSREYLNGCIESILCSTHDVEYEIIAIDSGSFDGCGEMLQKSFPQVRFIQSDKNGGFAKANNEAYQVSAGESLLFLNPDTEVTGNAIATLYRNLQLLPDAGMVGGKLLNSDRSIQTSCLQRFPNILNQLLDAEALRRYFPRWALWGTAPLFDQGKKPVAVEVISGACLMIKRAVFEKVGRFCEDYFMYSEDVDLAYRVKEAGYTAYYVPDAVVVHHGGASSSKSGTGTFSAVWLLESQRRFFHKTRPLWYGHLYRFAMLAASLLRVVLLLFAWPAFRLCGKGSVAEAGLRKWAARLRWALNLHRR